MHLFVVFVIVKTTISFSIVHLSNKGEVYMASSFLSSLIIILTIFALMLLGFIVLTLLSIRKSINSLEESNRKIAQNLSTEIQEAISSLKKLIVRAGEE